jgi:hypothetical protein
MRTVFLTYFVRAATGICKTGKRSLWTAIERHSFNACKTNAISNTFVTIAEHVEVNTKKKKMQIICQPRYEAQNKSLYFHRRFFLRNSFHLFTSAIAPRRFCEFDIGYGEQVKLKLFSRAT